MKILAKLVLLSTKYLLVLLFQIRCKIILLIFPTGSHYLQGICLLGHFLYSHFSLFWELETPILPIALLRKITIFSFFWISSQVLCFSIRLSLGLSGFKEVRFVLRRRVLLELFRILVYLRDLTTLFRHKLSTLLKNIKDKGFGKVRGDVYTDQ